MHRHPVTGPREQFRHRPAVPWPHPSPNPHVRSRRPPSLVHPARATREAPLAYASALVSGRRLPGWCRAGVLAAGGHEFVVAADLCHAGAVEDDDEVGHSDGAETVRDQDHDAAVVGLPPGARPRSCSNSACSVSASSAAVGSSRTSSSGSSRMKPRASASFCHCPKQTSTPPGQVGPSWVLEASRRACRPRRRRRPGDGGTQRRLVVQPGQVTQPDGLTRQQLEPEEVLVGAGQPGPPLRRAACRRRSTPSTRMRPSLGRRTWPTA